MFTFILINEASKFLKETIYLVNITTFIDSFVAKDGYETPFCLLREKKSNMLPSGDSRKVTIFLTKWDKLLMSCAFCLLVFFLICICDMAEVL